MREHLAFVNSSVSESTTEALRSKLRLFLSVDIVNSTAFKQATAAETKGSNSTLSETWFSPIARFYREIERLFIRHWTLQSAYAEAVLKPDTGLIELPGFDRGPVPVLWKAAGDEILFSKELTDHRQALVAINAWISAIQEHRLDLKAKFPVLDLKATAWLAGFPVLNAEMVLGKSEATDIEEQFEGDGLLATLLSLENRSPNQFVDYIGPSIDTGFRVATISTARKMCITVDLAFVLATALVNQSAAKPYATALNFYFAGRVPLKGVLDGENYPVIWLDTKKDDPLANIEDRMSGVKNVGESDVKRFTEIFIKSSGKGHLIVPYIEKDPDFVFSQVPQYHRDRLNKLKEYWDFESEKRRRESSDEDPSPAPSANESLAVSTRDALLDGLVSVPIAEPQTTSPTSA